MKKILYVIVLLGLCVNSFAQQLCVSEIKALVNDLSASVNGRVDNKGRGCALLKINVVGVKNLIFQPSVGQVEYSNNEYRVFVSPGISSVEYMSSDRIIKGEIDFSGIINVESKCVYSITLTGQDTSSCNVNFFVSPRNADLIVDGNKIEIDSNGSAILKMKPGVHSWSAKANEYDEDEDQFVVEEGQKAFAVNVDLQMKTYIVRMLGTPSHCDFYINDSEISTSPILVLKRGKYHIRIVAEGYREKSININVDRDMEYNVELKKDKVNKQSQKYIIIENHLGATGAINQFGKLTAFDGDLTYVPSHILIDIGIKYSFMLRRGIFAFKPALAFGLSSATDDYRLSNEPHGEDGYYNAYDSPAFVWANLPVQIGINLPLSKDIRKTMSLLGGGYVKYYLAEFEMTPWDGDKTISKYCNFIDYGACASLLFNFSKLSYEIYANQSFKGHKYSFGVSISWRILHGKE